jgi:putative peptidoglycan lipid II flippase
VPQPKWLMFFLKLLLAVTVMAASLWFLMGSEASWLNMSVMTRAMKLAGLVTVGAVVYFLSLWLMGFRLNDFARRSA